MFELKAIPADTIPRALERAERYRLLNEPREAESICRDILAIQPENQQALIGLILSLTDMFAAFKIKQAEVLPLLERLEGRFEREYYRGVSEERWAKALLHAGYQHDVVWEHLRTALNHYEAAEDIAPEGNDDAILRWNACVRLIQRHGIEAPAPAPAPPEMFEDDVPVW